MIWIILAPSLLAMSYGHLISGDTEVMQGETINLFCRNSNLVWSSDAYWATDGGVLATCNMASNRNCETGALSYPRATFMVLSTAGIFQMFMQITNAQVEDSRTFTCADIGGSNPGSITVTVNGASTTSTSAPGGSDSGCARSGLEGWNIAAIVIAVVIQTCA